MAREALKIKSTLDLSALAGMANSAAQAALPLVGEYIKQQSNAIAPLRQGTMIANSRVEVDGNKVVVGYFNTPYAARQHEGLHFHHPNGRQPKYLESVVNDPATSDAIKSIFAQAMQSEFGG